MEFPESFSSEEAFETWFIKFWLDFTYIRNGKDLDKLRQAIAPFDADGELIKNYVPITLGWRENALKKLGDAALSKDMGRCTDLMCAFGLLMGTFGELIDVLPAFGEGLEEIASTVTGKEMEEPLDTKALPQLSLDELTKEMTPDDKKVFIAGYGKSYRDILDDSTPSGLKRHSATVLVYFGLLLLEPEVRKQPTVEAIYDLVTDYFEGKLTIDLDSFRKICSRIGLRGNKYNDYKKSIKTGEKKLS
jgi:hypothetical protein